MLVVPRIGRAKPGVWAVDPMRVVPEWRWAWNRVDSYWPLWRSGEDLTGQRDLTARGTPAWAATPAGLGFAVDGVDRALELPTNLAGLSDFTLMVAFVLNAVPTANWNLFGCTEDSTFDGWTLLADNSEFVTGNTDTVAFRTSVGEANGESGAAMPTGSATAGVLHTAVVRIGPGGTAQKNVTIFMDGEQGTEITDGLDLQEAVGEVAALGPSAAGFTDAAIDGQILAAGLWDAALLDSQMKALSIDPFGPIRRARRRVTVAGGGAQTVSPGTAVATWSAVAPTPSPGAISRQASPAAGSWGAVPITPSPGPVSRQAGAAAGAWSALAALPDLGALAVPAPPAAGSWEALAAGVGLGAIARAAGVATGGWSAVPVSPESGVQTVPVAAAAGAWDAVGPAVQVGPVVAAASPAEALWEAVAALPQAGAQSILVVTAGGTWAAPAVTSDLGPLAVAVVPASGRWDASPVAAQLGSVTVLAAAADGTWAAVPVTVALGLLEPGPARSSGSTKLVLGQHRSTVLQLVDRASTILELINRGETTWPT